MARRQVARFPDCRVQVSSFEDRVLPADALDAAGFRRWYEEDWMPPSEDVLERLLAQDRTVILTDELLA